MRTDTTMFMDRDDKIAIDAHGGNHRYTTSCPILLLGRATVFLSWEQLLQLQREVEQFIHVHADPTSSDNHPVIGNALARVDVDDLMEAAASFVVPMEDPS